MDTHEENPFPPNHGAEQDGTASPSPERTSTAVPPVTPPPEPPKPSPITNSKTYSPQPDFPSLVEFIENYKPRPDFSYDMPKLDSITNGLHRKELIIVGGRPNEGKTSIAIQWAWMLAKKGKKVVFFSNEMHRATLWVKILARETQIAQGSILTDRISENERELLFTTFNHLMVGKGLYIYDHQEGTTRMDIVRILAKEKPDVFFIDHLQMVKTDKQFQKRNEAIEEIVNQTKLWADKMNCTGILLSQCSRSTEGRKNYLPFLSDLKGSGAIEEVADLVLLIAWPWKTVAPRDLEAITDEKERQKVEAEKAKYKEDEFYLEIAKNRMGGVGIVKLKFLKDKSLFLEEGQFFDREIPQEKQWYNDK